MRIAGCQVQSGVDPVENLALIERYAANAAAQGARVAVFPEAMQRCFGHNLTSIAEPIDGPWATEVARIAAAHDLVIVAGMFTPNPDGRVRNTVLVTGGGHHLGYDKIHLFDAFGFQESSTVAPGDALVTFTVDDWVIGVATCYDLRFPELFTALAHQGAQAIVVPTSWGAGPGKAAQWNLLVPARALDSTTYVIAVDQPTPTTGENPASPTGIGLSTAAAPDGTILHQSPTTPDLFTTTLHHPNLTTTRTKIPVLSNHRLPLS